MLSKEAMMDMISIALQKKDNKQQWIYLARELKAFGTDCTQIVCFI